MVTTPEATQLVGKSRLRITHGRPPNPKESLSVGDSTPLDAIPNARPFRRFAGHPRPRPIASHTTQLPLPGWKPCQTSLPAWRQPTK